MQQRGLILVVVLAAMVTAAAVARAQEPRAIGVFNDWVAYTYQAGSEKVCYIGSQPTTDEGNYTERGDIWALVTHRSPGTKGVVSIIIGYNFKENSDVSIKIGSNTYSLFTQGDTAWTRVEADDASLVAAMKAGSRMEVRGVSWRGTETKDTYSLSGFTKAYEAITTACTG
ncbi:MAG: invasion associated locus B family protein [Pseudomonadota bacterium]